MSVTFRRDRQGAVVGKDEAVGLLRVGVDGMPRLSRRAAQPCHCRRQDVDDLGLAVDDDSVEVCSMVAGAG